MVTEFLHDTELCASEEVCDRAAYRQDLCRKHFVRSEKNNTLPPVFKRYSKGLHALGERNSKNERWCSKCRTFVPLDHSVLNKEKCGIAARSAQRKSATGWSLEEYDQAIIEQGNRCYLCGEKSVDKGLRADHCHSTGKTRKLLCSNCNLALGLFKDNATVLRRAAEYVGE